eukprot:Tbor_TRINITY_DN5327_c2_g1::TRINITY_DN5327_c2_g1_i1::g.4955::m.4955
MGHHKSNEPFPSNPYSNVSLRHRKARRDNTRLYELLQVDPSVRAKEIHSTFKDIHLREQYWCAFDILSNQYKKRVYDIGGEWAVTHLENKGWGSVIVVLGSTASLAVYGICWILLSLLLGIFLLLISAKIDKWGMEESPWHVIMAPLYIIVFGGLLGTIIALVMAVYVPRGKVSSLISFRAPVVRLIVISAYAASLVVIGTYIGMGISWIGIGVLIMVVEVIAIIDWMSVRHPGKIMKLIELHPTSEKPLTDMQAIATKHVHPTYPMSVIYGYIVLGVFDICLTCCRNLFLALKVDGSLTWSWYAVFVPIALRLISSVLFRLQQNWIQVHIKQKDMFDLVLGFVGSSILNALLILSLYLIAYLLEGGDILLTEALLPAYLVVIYLIVASIFTAIYVIWADYRLKNLEIEELQRTKQVQPDYESIGSDDEMQQISSMGTESVFTNETFYEEVEEEETPKVWESE